MLASQIQIRLATYDDLVDVQRCARLAYTKYIERMGREPAPMMADFASQISEGYVYVAQDADALAGYVVFYRKADHLHLENVAVMPARAGNGIGRMLVEYVEQAARDQECVAVELYTNEAMTENLQLYPRLGYVETGRKTQDGFKRVFFRKAV